MLLNVTFNVVKSDIYQMLFCRAAGKQISEEEGNNRLAPSSTEAGSVCVLTCVQRGFLCCLK